MSGKWEPSPRKLRKDDHWFLKSSLTCVNVKGITFHDFIFVLMIDFSVLEKEKLIQRGVCQILSLRFMKEEFVNLGEQCIQVI